MLPDVVMGLLEVLLRVLARIPSVDVDLIMREEEPQKRVWHGFPVLAAPLLCSFNAFAEGEVGASAALVHLHPIVAVPQGFRSRGPQIIVPRGLPRDGISYHVHERDVCGAGGELSGRDGARKVDHVLVLVEYVE